MRKIGAVAFLAFLALVAGCRVNPVTGKQEFAPFSLFEPSSAEQAKIGAQYAPEITKQLGGPIPNQQLQSYISQVGNRVAKANAPDANFTFSAVNDDTINAFALPGGYIFITKGMLKQLKNEAQLASILGHEAAHVTLQHSAQAMGEQIGMDTILKTISISGQVPASVTTIGQVASQLIGLRYSRTHESQADAVGMDYMVKAGYDPAGMSQSMQILESAGGSGGIEFLSTHPSPANRLATINSQIRSKYPNVRSTDLGEASYKQNVLSVVGSGK